MKTYSKTIIKIQYTANFWPHSLTNTITNIEHKYRVTTTCITPLVLLTPLSILNGACQKCKHVPLDPAAIPRPPFFARQPSKKREAHYAICWPIRVHSIRNYGFKFWVSVSCARFKLNKWIYRLSHFIQQQLTS